MPSKALPIRERILKNVTVDAGGCWRWQRRKDRHGYGRICVRRDGRSVPALAHRVAFTAFVGEPPAGLQLDHLCRVRDCVNPEHLEPVTAAVNMSRATWPARTRTACPQGHPYDEENTVVDRRGYRSCRECNRVAARRYKAAKRALKAGDLR